MYRLLDRPLVAAVLLSATIAQAAPGGLLDGELGRWVNAEAGPTLIEILDQHPRFRGETLRVVPMRRGQPLSRTDRLSLALQRSLEHQLLQSHGVRVAVTDTVGRCGLKADIPYLLGVEVDSDGPNRHRVHLAVTDVDEGIWVNGASQTWSGRLTTAQRNALGEQTSTAQPGTLSNPLPLSDSPAIAKALKAQLSCEIHSLPTMAVRVVSDDAVLEGVRHHLDTHLRGSAQLRPVTDQGEDTWLLKVRSTSTGAQRDVVLELTHPTRGHADQRLASVVVSGFGSAPRPTAVDPLQWLSDLQYESVASQGVCRRAAGADCVEITVTAHQPLYVMVLHTRDGKVDVPSCGRSPARRQGKRRFRFTFTNATRPTSIADAGFYAIATNNGGVARRIAQQLAEAPGACNSRSTPTEDSRSTSTEDNWLAQLDLLLSQHAGSIQWRALHLNREPEGPIAL